MGRYGEIWGDAWWSVQLPGEIWGDLGRCLVIGAVVALVRVRVEDRGPHGGRPFPRGHGHVEHGEVGEAALVPVANVHEDREHPGAPRGGARAILVVVRLVEVARLVPQHLHR